MADSEYLFTYGTLRPPWPNTPADDVRYYPTIADYIRSHRPATVTGAQIFDLGGYPAAVRGEGVVQGDLLELDPAALPITDRIEGHPTFFRRTRVTVQTNDGAVDAWLYWAPPGLTQGKRRIANGDWFRRHENPVEEEAKPLATPSASNPALRALVERFAQSDCSWLNTVRLDGRPHSAPIWHVWRQGRIYIASNATAVRVKNIARNPNVVITHPDPLETIIIEGWATTAEHMRAALRDLFLAKYQWDITTDTEAHVILEIMPTKLLSWGKGGVNMGRWDGAAVMQSEP